jgi:hypothetical protein
MTRIQTANAIELAIFALSLTERLVAAHMQIQQTIATAQAEGRDVTPEEVAASKARVDADFAATMERFKTPDGGVI